MIASSEDSTIAAKPLRIFWRLLPGITQSLLRILPIGNVLDDTDDSLSLIVSFPQKREGCATPDNRTILADIALFEDALRNLTSQQDASLCLCCGEIFGVDDLRQGQSLQFVK